MRVKTDARREAILAAATELFRDVGYERASMALLSTRFGGSKATLYNYFRSKEELFACVMMEAVEEQGVAVIAMLDPSDKDVRAVLHRFGFAYLKLVTAPETLALTRTGIAEGANSELGARLYEGGPQRAWDEIARFIERLQERGAIGPGDPLVIAGHLKGLLETGCVEPLLWGAKAQQDFSAAVEGGVDVFLRAYGVDGAVS
ncbi:TetR/AcrR family transcriptional regulator [Sphingobium sp.]|uniref:TetR/AcrR family transcriptional regulator n=1 Tax=Sphingobium sp. TaxID=1912891 RepID=UPI000DAFD81E|nr:TetR/AcrR family transcriptional regulator [Sphingobium sp.]PZU69327.1 MAG: TetR family transcriptional regulator [Sphingobium sp.]